MQFDYYNLDPATLMALYEFYNSTNGEVWGNSEIVQESGYYPWDFSGNPQPCGFGGNTVWYGVTCASDYDSEYYYTLTSIGLSSTGLKGKIPETFYNLTNLQYFDLGGNELSGTISSGIGNFKNVWSIYMGSNKFTGTLPESLSELPILMYFDVSDNQLHGNPTNSFNTTKQFMMTYIDLSYNQFTGTIPETVISFPYINTVNLGHNCFHGSIPELLCNTRTMFSLTLTGANAASSCQIPLIHYSTYSSYIVKNPFTGSIPKCLLEVNTLFTLYLDNLGLSTTLPDDVQLTNLDTLVVSNNAIYGSIPLAYQQHFFKKLDLSSNKLSGVLSDSYICQQHLDLTYNRLSNVVPPELIAIDNCRHDDFGSFTKDILEGNSFACLPNRSDLPKDDPYYDKYQQCGSTAFDNTLYGAVGIVAGSLLVLGILILLKSKSNTIKKIASMVTDFRNCYESILSKTTYHRYVGFINHWSCVLTLFICVLLIPLYVTLSQYYATQTYKYAWIVSGVYLNGLVSTLCIMAVILLILLLTYLVMHRQSVSFALDKSFSISISSFFDVSKILWMFVMFTVSCLDIIFIIGVNTSYLAITRIASEDTVQKVSVAMSVFKLGWNLVVVRNILRFLTFRSPIKDFHVQQRWFTSLETALVLFNNIIAPYIATLLVSGTCLQNAFVHDSDNAAFLYSYQCSSTYITTYASVFLFMFALTAVGFPILQYFATRLHAFVYTRKERAISSLINKFLNMMQPKLLFPEIIVNDVPEQSKLAKGYCCVDLTTINPTKKRLFCSDLLVVDLVSMFAIMLTFGVVVPSVALLGCIAIVSTTMVNDLIIGRGIRVVQNNYGDDASKIEVFVEELKLECSYFDSLFRSNIFIIMPFVAVFYGLLVFDMLGDTEGAVQASWAPIAVFALIFLTTIVARYCSKDIEVKDADISVSMPLLKEIDSGQL